ncbi:helix-turn-helix domain-containing protein [Erwiniaceae bacterium CAU 1747]
MSINNSNTLGYLTDNIPSYIVTSMKTMNLAERLQAAMDKRGYTQASLAEAAGISQPSIWKIVTGKTRSTKRIVEIASALKVRPEWLLNGTGEMEGFKAPAGVYSYDKTERGVPDKEPDDKHRLVNMWDESGITKDIALVPREVSGEDIRAYKLKHPSGFSEIPQGSIIIIDTKEKPGNEDYVFVDIKGSLSIYRFKSGGESGYLDSGDTRIPLLPITEDTKIVGVVVYLSRFFRK